jgi:tRNA 2-selenouridine synthase
MLIGSSDSCILYTMREMPVYFLDVPLEEEQNTLLHTYASLSHDKLVDAISRITKRLG